MADDVILAVIARLNELAKESDYEEAHSEADDILCDVLVICGRQDVVEAYARVGKWYA